MFGVHSGAAMAMGRSVGGGAAMLLVVRIANRSRGWYDGQKSPTVSQVSVLVILGTIVSTAA